MNNERTFRIVLHVPQEDMVKIVQAARALMVNQLRAGEIG